MTFINQEWDTILEEHLKSESFLKLMTVIDKEYDFYNVLPKYENIFTAFKTTSFEKLKVVIIGQDPYQTPNYSHGLAFSVTPGIKIPKSLINIFKELTHDLGCTIPNNGYLKKWADQGVLLLNTILTVREGETNSHKGLGWEDFTDFVINKINNELEHVVFILWGNLAKKKKQLITNSSHYIIESVHPSPLSAFNGFFHSKPFSKTNDFLKSQGIEPIDWQIDNIEIKNA